jgi:23S rRNA G2069 N7-methylase RlmK/C1962 C5-methylase RlmI
MSEAFARRLQKNMRRLKSWAQKRAITCFRAYDRDLPEVPLALDLYTELDTTRPDRAGNVWLHATLFEPRHGIDAARAAAWLNVACETLGIDRARAVLKRRAQGATHEKLADTGARIVVEEAGCALLVNLFDYVDTGLFLDHRASRALVRAACAGKRVLNLFAYTGAFSVQAAAGGATETVSVDLSPTYARWAEENLALNHFDTTKHRVEVADALSFLKNARDARETGAKRIDRAFDRLDRGFDWVVIDPPTISKSKRADSFDVQRDHLRLISAAFALLAPHGTIFFSTNFQGFVLDRLDALGDDVKSTEITARTVPEDFPRKPSIHRAWLIERASKR